MIKKEYQTMLLGLMNSILRVGFIVYASCEMSVLIMAIYIKENSP